MDTRTKIVSAETAAGLARECRASGRRITLVWGHFDPLLAAHARRLGELASPGAVLIAAVSEPARPILPARARAELVAALAAVDYVVLPGPGGALDGLEADAISREEAADERRTGDLMRHVQSRHE
ncbi:MAG: hypothetical protein ABSD27_08805 [Bryobacteraceae bacterium]